MSDSLSVIIWWFTIFIVGTIFLPITATIFKKFIDRGYIFTKVLGMLIASYLMWFLGSLHLLPFTYLSLAIILLGFALISIYLVSIKNRNGSKDALPWKFFLFEEILFFTALVCWSYVRATEPSIRSLEKFMDFGFVNSILRSTYFPPLDMWLTKSPDYLAGSGGFINYYYFGHYITAFLTKLSGLDSAVTYNLMIATLFAFTFTLPFSIGANLYYLFNDPGSNSRRNDPGSSRLKIIIVGFLAAFLVSLGGNLHALYVFTSGYPNETPQPPWKLELGIHPERYWYPNATRFIPFTIHEFPIYSFVVADLHGHVSDIPLVMLILAILLSITVKKSYSSSDEQSEDLRSLKNNSSRLRSNNILNDFQNHTSVPLPTIIFLGILLASMYMTNAWDGLIYMVLSVLVFLVNTIKGRASSEARPFLTSLYKTFSASLFLLFFFLLASLPFSLNFKPFVSGIGVLCAPKFLEGKALGPILFEAGKCQKSPIYQLTILWGFFYFNVIGYLVFVVIPALRIKLAKREESKSSRQARTITHYSSSDERSEESRSFGIWKLLRLIGIPRAAGKIENFNPVDIFVLLLILVSTLLLIFPEFFYIKDIYPAHYRANTMFKLGYQAFMMLGIASSFIIFRIKKTAKRSKSSLLFFVFCYLLFFLVAIYPYFAINSYYGNLQTYRGLYGLSWMTDQYNDDKKAIEWMRKNIKGQPVIVEANGDSYTDYDRVSANTGLPTIIGWPVHEWLWRGSYDEAGRRIPEVTAIYESKDLGKTKEILKKYNAQYIFVGNLEREKYKNLDEKKIESLGKVVFESGRTRVYKIML